MGGRALTDDIFAHLPDAAPTSQPNIFDHLPDAQPAQAAARPPLNPNSWLETDWAKAPNSVIAKGFYNAAIERPAVGAAQLWEHGAHWAARHLLGEDHPLTQTTKKAAEAVDTWLTQDTAQRQQERAQAGLSGTDIGEVAGTVASPIYWAAGTGAGRVLEGAGALPITRALGEGAAFAAPMPVDVKSGEDYTSEKAKQMAFQGAAAGLPALGGSVAQPFMAGGRASIGVDLPEQTSAALAEQRAKVAQAFQEEGMQSFAPAYAGDAAARIARTVESVPWIGNTVKVPKAGVELQAGQRQAEAAERAGAAQGDLEAGTAAQQGLNRYATAKLEDLEPERLERLGLPAIKPQVPSESPAVIGSDVKPVMVENPAEFSSRGLTPQQLLIAGKGHVEFPSSGRATLEDLAPEQVQAVIAAPSNEVSFPVKQGAFYRQARDANPDLWTENEEGIPIKDNDVAVKNSQLLMGHLAGNARGSYMSGAMEGSKFGSLMDALRGYPERPSTPVAPPSFEDLRDAWMEARRALEGNGAYGSALPRQQVQQWQTAIGKDIDAIHADEHAPPFFAPGSVLVGRTNGQWLPDTAVPLQNSKDLLDGLANSRLSSTAARALEGTKLGSVIDKLQEIQLASRAPPPKEPTFSVNDLMAAKTEVGRALRGDDPLNKQLSSTQLKAWYAALSDDVEAGLISRAAKARRQANEGVISQDVADQADKALHLTKQADAYTKAGMERMNQFADVMNAETPEQAARLLASSLRRNTQNTQAIEALTEVLRPEEARSVLGHVIDDLGRDPKTGAFSLKRQADDWAKINSEPRIRAVLSNVLGDSTVRTMDNISTIARGMQQYEKQSPLFTHGVVGMVGLGTLLNPAHWPALIAASGVAAPVAGKILTSPTFARWAAKQAARRSQATSQQAVEAFGDLASEAKQEYDPEVRSALTAAASEAKQSVLTKTASEAARWALTSGSPVAAALAGAQAGAQSPQPAPTASAAPASGSYLRAVPTQQSNYLTSPVGKTAPNPFAVQPRSEREWQTLLSRTPGAQR